MNHRPAKQMKKQTKNKPKGNPYLSFGAIAFVILLTVSLGLYYYYGLTSLLSYLIGINLASATITGLDKGAAKGNSLRVPEIIFFTIALLGGALGILTCMHLIRHKTRKHGFVFTLGALALVQLYLISLIIK